MTAMPATPIPLQGWGAHARALGALGVPLIGSNIANFAIHLTDIVLLGWYDVNALAAVTLATSLYFVVFLMGSGFGWAVTPLVAAAAVAGDDVQVRRVTRMGLWLSVAFGIVTCIPMMWAEPFFLAIGQDPVVSALAQDYLTIAAWGMIPALVITVLRAFLSALERTAIILWATLGAVVINALVGYGLIFGAWGLPEMGIQGAAWAAMATLALSGVVMLAYVLRVFPTYRLWQRIWRIDPSVLARVFRLGAPIGLTSLAEGGLFSASAVMVGWIGAVELAAHGIALQLASAAFMFHLGLSQATTVRAGRAMGQRDGDNLRRTAHAALMMSLGFSLIGITLFLAMPQVLIGAFIDPEEPQRAQLLAIGVTMLLVAALFQAVDGLQVVALGLLRGVQDTAVPMLLAAISYWVVGIPASYVLGFVVGWGAVGVWLGLVIGLLLAAVMLLARFWLRAVRFAGV